MSESELATAAGLTAEQVRAYEAGERRLGAPRLLQFCQLLGVPVSWFFVGIGKDGEFEFGGKLPSPESVTSFASEKAQIEELLHSFESIANSKERQLVLALAQTLADKEARQKIDNSGKN